MSVKAPGIDRLARLPNAYFILRANGHSDHTGLLFTGLCQGAVPETEAKKGMRKIAPLRGQQE